MTEGQIRIRPSLHEDLPKLAELEQLCFHPPWTENMLRAELDSTDARVLVAEVEGCFSGFAVFHRAGDQAELYQIAVCPERRRRGIASQLLKAGAEASVKLNCGSVFLEVRRSNQAAIGLYESHGYVYVGKRKRYYESPEEDAFLYMKELTV